jgi:hypothetical protein
MGLVTPRRSVIGTVKAVSLIVYTDKKYRYFRYFSNHSLDSFQIVCYKPSGYPQGVFGKVYEGRPLQDAGLSPSSVLSVKS